MSKEELIEKYGEKIKSSEWSLGGQCWNYNGDSWGESGEEPCDFDKLDEVLEEVVPSITYLQFKKVYNVCVKIEEYTDRDYYSCLEKAYYVCDTEELYDKLEELGLL